MKDRNEQTMSSVYYWAGIFTFSLRIVVGWTYFSAFWRRVALENKLIPDEPGYIGEKFNHFLPNALGIKPMIEYLVTHPDALWWAMVIFTIIEGIVGLLFMLGILTRLMSIGIFSLAFGILLGSGWIGTTCLDEWQIGILGVAAGFTVFLSGGGRYSLDYSLIPYLSDRLPQLERQKWLTWITSGVLPLSGLRLKQGIIVGSLAILLLSLATNQIFHGGVWGTLHNKSVKPKVEISNSQLNNGELAFTVYRIEGVDVYGSFLIGISVEDEKGSVLWSRTNDELVNLSGMYISNEYVTKVKPGKHSLIIPLGGKARIRIRDEAFSKLTGGKYVLRLTDISGATWTSSLYL